MAHSIISQEESSDLEHSLNGPSLEEQPSPDGNSASSRPRTTSNNKGIVTVVSFYLGFVTVFIAVLYSSFLIMSVKENEETVKRLRNTIKIMHVAFIIFALVSIMLFVCNPDSTGHGNTETSPSESSTVVLFALVLQSVLMAICVTVKVVVTVGGLKRPEYDTVLESLMHLVAAVFCVVQSLFFGRYRHLRCSRNKHKLLTAILVSNNIILCLGASFTFADKRNDDKSVEKAERLYYSFIFGYCMLSLLFLFKILNININNNESTNNSTLLTIRSEFNELLAWNCPSRICVWFCRIYSSSMRFVCKYVIVWSPCLCVALLVFHIITIDDSMLFLDVSCFPSNSSVNTTTTIGAEVYSYLRSVYYYAVFPICLLGLLLDMKLYNFADTFSMDDILLMFSGGSQLIIVTFQFLDVCVGIAEYEHSDMSMKISYLFKTVFHILGLFCQTFIILKYSNNTQVIAQGTNRNLYIRAVIVFLAVVNLDRWVRVLVFSPSAGEYIRSIGKSGDIFGSHVWCQISKLVNPMAAYYRLQSAIMCWNIYRSPHTNIS